MPTPGDQEVPADCREDEIHYQPPKPPTKNIIGGAGAYSALGARLVSPPPHSGTVGWVVDAGSDFPEEIRNTIASWDTNCLVRETPWRLTTRGWNGYDEYEKRVTALRERPSTIQNSHLTESESPPLFIWEPVPDVCSPEELANCYEALRHVDIVSPNHSELGAFFGHDATIPESGEVDRKAVEKHCSAWLGWGIGGESRGAVVVRAGKSGCFIANSEGSKWIPAYHDSSSSKDHTKVVDPTGGGNAFLGGLGIGLVREGFDHSLRAIEEAAILGNVAASFAIEQVGMPSLIESDDGETWNGSRVKDRLESFKERLKTYVQP
ncbi:MAG: hypothetical protein M4579_000691 [Chaenotheca gracillima]|nr:MAG: hypothetical protein M4579_000691 [Chaenotheca gracillima]